MGKVSYTFEDVFEYLTINVSSSAIIFHKCHVLLEISRRREFEPLILVRD